MILKSKIEDLDTLAKREQFAVSLRRQKKSIILAQKREKLRQGLQSGQPANEFEAKITNVLDKVKEFAE